MILEILVGLLSLLIGYCVYLKKVKWTYFEKKGILQMPTSLPFGNFNEMIFQVGYWDEIHTDLYGHFFSKQLCKTKKLSFLTSVLV
jgi:hypothetical protein